MAKAKDLTGLKFGRLTVIERTGTAKNGAALWRCVCQCGKDTIANASHLTGGFIQSCGCLKSEAGRENCLARNTKHGDSRHGKYKRLYGVWHSMRDRCLNSNHHAYASYGGRGITICPEWSDYQNFKAWAVEEGYDPDAPYGKITLDRIDCDKGYSPDNCRWVDMKTQADNRRSGRDGSGRYTKAEART